MADSQSHAVKCLNTSGGRRRFVFKNFSQRVGEIDIDVFRSLHPVKSQPSDGSSFFLEALKHWRELNTAEHFISFFHEMMPHVQTLPQILLHKEKIFSELLSRLQMKAKLSLGPILMLLVALSRDILEEFLLFLPRLVSSVFNLLKDGGDRDPEVLEQVFTAWSYIMMHLQKYLVKDVVHVLKTTTSLRFYQKDYVQEFMAEAISFLLRNSSVDQLQKGFKKIIREVAKNPLPDIRSGAIALLCNVMRGTSLKIHSRAEIVIGLLLDKSILGNDYKLSQGSEAILEVTTGSICRLCENIDQEDLNSVYNSVFKEICNNLADGCPIHLTRLLTLLKSIVSHTDRSKIFDKEKMVEIVRLLMQAYIISYESLNPDDFSSSVVHKILQLMLCLLDAPLISSDLSSILVLYAPVFECKNSSLIYFIKGLILKGPPVTNFFRSYIISSLNNLVEVSPNEVLFLLLTYLKKQTNGTFWDILEGVSEDRIVNICRFFEEALCSWAELTKDIASGDDQTKIQVNESKLATLWGVICCYPHFQTQQNNGSSMQNLISNLDELLETKTDNIAGLSTTLWESLLGAGLKSLNFLLSATKDGPAKTCRFLHHAKRHKHSPQVLLAAAEFLDSHLGSNCGEDATEPAFQELGVSEAVDAFSIFAENLSVPNKSVRVSTLRILSHYAPLQGEQSMTDERPHKKLKTEESEPKNKDTQYKVIELLLSVESTPLSISTTRKAIILVSRLQMALTSSKIHNDYITLLLHGLVGILHNRFGYLWEPVVDCLSVLIGRYRELIWDRFIQLLGAYQSDFLSSGNQQVKCPDSAAPKNLGEFFKLSLVVDCDSTPCWTVITLLLKSLQKIPGVAESHSRQLMPLFLKFLGYEDGNLTRVESFSSYNCKRKEWRIILKDWLSLLSLLRNARSLYQSHIFKEVLINRLLDETDPDIQLKVLDCLMNWREDSLIPYEQHLRNLVISKNVREELTVWSVSKESYTIQEGHRQYLIPIVVRLLMPKVRKRKTLASQKNAGVNHRRAVLYFLAQLDVHELRLFFTLLLKPFFVSGNGIIIPSEAYRSGLQPCSLFACGTSMAIDTLSWKKTCGFLHVVEDIMKTFDELHIIPFLNFLMDIIVRILENCMRSVKCANGSKIPMIEDTPNADLGAQENEAIAPDSKKKKTSIKQYKDLRSLCLRIISFVLNRYDFHDYDSGFWDIFFKAVKPLTDSFKQEGSSSEKPGSLFSCFVAMSQSPNLVQLLNREANLIPAIFSILTVRTASEAITSSVLTFSENLLNLANDLDAQDHDSLKRILLPHIETLIHSLYVFFQSHKEANRKSKMRPGKGELRIFKLLVKYIRDPMSAGHFIDMVLPFFKQKNLEHDGCLEALLVIMGTLPILDGKTSGKVLDAIHPLLVHVDLDLRLCICEILDVLMLNDPSLAHLAKLLRQLNAVSSSEIGELDYDTRVKAYESIRPELFSLLNEVTASVILSQCVYDMSSDELIFRHSASRSLQSFIQFALPILDKKCQHEIVSHDEAHEDKLGVESGEINVAWTRTCIQRIIKRIFLRNMGEAMSQDISIQKEWIALLREMIYNFKGEQALNSFRSLCSEDAEVDFFNNILHLQIHRRTRALARFRNVISMENVAENITVKVFVPLFFNMLFNVKDGKGEHLRNACVDTLASISSQMQWDSYRTLLMRCFMDMKLKPDKRKILLRLICAILDKFHFSEPKAQEVKEDGYEISVPGTREGGLVVESSSGNSDLSIPSYIQTYLQGTVLPRMQKLLTSDPDKINANISLAALKLIKLLPVDYMESQLPSIIHRICNFLKNRLESVRDEARHALAACANELGVGYLQFIVKVLRAILKRGYELHVLGYTLNYILSYTLTDSIVGKLDYCLEDLLSVAENDIVGDVAEEKEVDKIVSKTKEARTSRSYDTLKVIAQMVTFRTNALKLLLPVSKHLERHITPKKKSKLEMMLLSIASGIESNPSAHTEELFVFVYGLIEDGKTEVDLQGEPTPIVMANNLPSHGSARKTNAHGLVKSHLFSVFALGVLQKRLKSMKLDSKDERLLSWLDPFVKLLGECLTSKYEDVLSATFRCLALLVKLPLPSFEAQTDRIKLLLLGIAQKSGNPNSILVQSCLKLLTALLQSNRTSLSDDQLHLLIQFPIFIDVQTNPSPIALNLLKAIIGQKLVVHEIYDIVMTVAELMITSQSEPIRKKCSQILLRFLLDYPLSDKRLQQHMDFLLTNLSYEHSSGREAVLEMLHTVLIKFPRSVLDTQAHTFFLHLVVALANECDDKVRSMVAMVIIELFGRTGQDSLQSILEYSLSWYLGGKQHLWSAAAQVIGLLVEVLKKGFQRHMSKILDVTKKILKYSVDASTNEYNAPNGPVMASWREPYYSLIMLEKMLLSFPELYLDKNLEDLWEMISQLLLHPHPWLRSLSSRLVALYFASVSDASRVDDLRPKKIGTLYLVNSSRLFVVAVSMLNQLKAELIDDAASNIVTQNLVFSVCGLHSFIKQKSSILLHELWSTLDSLEQGSYLRGFELLGSRKARKSFLLAASIAKTPEKDEMKRGSNEDLQALLMVPLLKRMGKLAMQMEDAQTQIILNSLKLIASQIGIEGCHDYATYIVLPVYKVCEDFAGKVVSDGVKQLADEVRDSIRAILGAEKFIQAYNEVRKTLKGGRDKRKQKLKLAAVINPMRHAKRKLRIAEKHRAHKKRKIEAMKMKRLSR